MIRTHLGEFEEIVLLAVAVADGQAYGASLVLEIGTQTGRELRLNQVHSALERLEEKGMLKSTLGEPTAERGGKRKRLFSVTTFGLKTLREIQQIRAGYWERLPGAFKLSME